VGDRQHSHSTVIRLPVSSPLVSSSFEEAGRGDIPVTRNNEPESVFIERRLSA
jgi:hypothetical protein